VDFENLQKIDTNVIDPKTKVIVMVGLAQDNKAIEFAKNLFNNISAIELIKVNGRGPNALDIFIAFYIGRYFDSIKESEIIIFSKDSDYDQLIKHLDGYGISIKRIGIVEEIEKKIIDIDIEKPKPNQKKKESPKTVETNNTKKIVEIKEPKQKQKKKNSPKIIETDDTKIIIEYLQKQTGLQKSRRPKKIETLENYLSSYFSKKLSIDKIKMAIEFMKSNKHISVTDNKISYDNI
jgi:hypothetical protein